jgi:hypothetical protein
VSFLNEVGLDAFCGLGEEGVDGAFCLHDLSNLVEVDFKPSNELGLSFPMGVFESLLYEQRLNIHVIHLFSSFWWLQKNESFKGSKKSLSSFSK